MSPETTQRDLQQARILESVKIGAVTALARQVGNDFNNRLAAIQGHIEAALRAVPAGNPEIHEELNWADQETRKAARAVRHLMRVAHPPRPDFKQVDVGVVIAEAIDEVEPSFPRRIAIDADIDHGPWVINADRQQLVDILVNLAYNARDAMPEGGTFSIRSQHIPDATGIPDMPQEVWGQPFIRIEVADTGCGISADVLPQIFDPFFTTKHGENPGLGLAGVYQVLQQHGGGITVDSAPREGTVFRIYLPATTPADVIRESEGDALRGTETVLVIDDELAVRRIVTRVLRHNGYQVLEAADGREGLATYEANRERIDLVVLDILMPEMSGWEVLDRLDTYPARPPVIVQSGYVVRQGAPQLARSAAFLRKPYQLSDLVRTVRRVLDGVPTPRP